MSTTGETWLSKIGLAAWLGCLAVLAGCISPPAPYAPLGVDGGPRPVDLPRGPRTRAEPDALIAVTREPAGARFYEVRLRVGARSFGQVDLPEAALLLDLETNPAGTHGLLTSMLVDDNGITPELRWHLVSFEGGNTVDLMESLAAIDGGLCERAGQFFWSLRARWRSDYGAVVVNCDESEYVGDSFEVVESGVFQVDLDGTPRQIASTPLYMVVPASGRLILARGDGAAYLLDPEAGVQRPFPLAVTEWVRSTFPSPPGFIVSELDDRLRSQNLRWVGEGGETRLLDASFEGSTYILPVSPEGVLAKAQYEESTYTTTTIALRDLDSEWVHTELSDCSTWGAPEPARWAPDGSALTVTCDRSTRRTRVVHRDGRAIATDLPASDALEGYVGWRPDSGALLRELIVGAEPGRGARGKPRRWELVDPTEGTSTRLPVLDALDAPLVRWRAESPPPASVYLY